MMRTILLAALAIGSALLPRPTLSADRPMLRGDIVAQTDVLTLGELVEGTPPALAATPIFRAPALGQTGTIQARRIAQSAESLGLPGLETRGRLQIAVTRATRRIGIGPIEALMVHALAGPAGTETGRLAMQFDGGPPELLLAPDIEGEPALADLTFDRRTRRASATIWVGPTASERRGQVRVSGTLVELVEAQVVLRGLERGETVRPGDVVNERRPRDSAPSDLLADAGPVAGRVARRAIPAGTILRAGDLAKPEIVARGDIVSVTYEAPGMILTMRAQAQVAGALGDAITVVNPGTKKVLQGVIVAPGKVSVSAAMPGRLATSQP